MLTAAALLPFAAAPAAAASPDRSQPAARAAQVRILGTGSQFSPNADGHRDRLAVRYRLSAPARVSVEVQHRGRTVVRTAPKVRRAGTRSFVWDGTLASGKRAADGAYRVVLHATGHATTRSDAARVVVDTSPTRLDVGTFGLSSDTVYPYATVIDDVVVGNFGFDSLYYGDTWNEQQEWIAASRAQVVDRDGHVVATERFTPASPRTAGGSMDGPTSCGPCGRFTWDGRDSDGVRQAPGTYRIRVVHGRDAAGNLRIAGPVRAVTVSAAQLEPSTTVRDLLAADATRTYDIPTGCLGCEVSSCPPVDSTRFTGGLTFDRTPSHCRVSSALFTTPVPGRRTPYDTFSVAATGGPSTEGGDGSADLRTYTGLTIEPSHPMTGDATVSTDVVSVSPNSEVYPSDHAPSVTWLIDGLAGSYDIASFTVTIHTYVPVA
ncbi:hypothetical protein GCM10009795_027290 [Nocardioides hankookensis]